ncbi:hypothetical protein HYH02_007051 [Chlamydomonas schloesseri]|uniref:Uncharacterized protein n=1 Tax=Chlamydomonas schloesseri TaxID=2026947 RepID=A0A835WIN8_9CHLO|nr:hypothetical protein HYH02_007051 [Chlamydomonas schloesseri]|eukprot:KAG2448023.1 hypothetical protein HYH02_007051 [Chlamydomonas schloesseri]
MRVLQALVDAASERPGCTSSVTHAQLLPLYFNREIAGLAAAALPALSHLDLGSINEEDWEAALQSLQLLLPEAVPTGASADGADSAGAAAGVSGAKEGGGNGNSSCSALHVPPLAQQPLPLQELKLWTGGELPPLPPGLLAGLAACTSLRCLTLSWSSVQSAALAQLATLRQLQRLELGELSVDQLSVLQPLTGLTKLGTHSVRGIATAGHFAAFPSLRSLDIGSSFLDVRGLEALSCLTSLSTGMLLGPEHVTAVGPAYGGQDAWALGLALTETGGVLIGGALPPLQLPLPSYPLPPRLEQLRFQVGAQFVEVLAAVQPPDSLQKVMVVDGNCYVDTLQLPLLYGRHTSVVTPAAAAAAAAAAGGVGGAAAAAGVGAGGAPELLPAAAQAVARFAQQLGSRWSDCRDVRVIFVGPQQQPQEAAAAAAAGQEGGGEQAELVLLPPHPAQWWDLQEAPSSHGGWLSPLAAMPELGGLWLQGLALTAADLRAIAAAFTGIRTLSLLGPNLRGWPFPALLALGPLLPRLDTLRLAADDLLLQPAGMDRPRRARAHTLRGLAAGVLAALCNLDFMTMQENGDGGGNSGGGNGHNNSRSVGGGRSAGGGSRGDGGRDGDDTDGTGTDDGDGGCDTGSDGGGGRGFGGTVQLVCGCRRLREGEQQDRALLWQLRGDLREMAGSWVTSAGLTGVAQPQQEGGAEQAQAQAQEDGQGNGGGGGGGDGVVALEAEWLGMLDYNDPDSAFHRFAMHGELPDWED